jgi:hypothetical protein
MNNTDIEDLNKLATDIIVEARTMAIGDIEGLSTTKGQADDPNGDGPDPKESLHFDPAKANLDQTINELDTKYVEASQALNEIGQWIASIKGSLDDDDIDRLEKYKGLLDQIISMVDCTGSLKIKHAG